MRPATVRRLMAMAVLLCLTGTASAATGMTVLAAPPNTGPVIVFYPASATTTKVRRGPFTLDLAVNAVPQRGNGHLIVMSHGSGGSFETEADLAQTFVAAGFTVAMPEHAGDNWHDQSDVGPASWKHRPLEVSQAIDAMATDTRFAPLLDFHHIGVYGMSAGGLTALTLAGARWSPALLAQHCDAHLAEDFPACAGLFTALDGGIFDGVRLAVARLGIHFKFGDDKALQGRSDPRIAVAVATVPVATPIDMASLANPRIPVGLVRAGHDDWLAPRWHIDAVRAACKACVLIADMALGSHGSILSPQPPDLPPREAKLLNDPPGFDRASIPGVYAAITGFFVQNLLR